MEHFAHSSETGHHMMSGWSSHAGCGVWGWLFMLVMVAVVIVVIVWLVKLLGSKSTTAQKEDPLDILKSRYAKGEIDKKQFDEVKKDISSKSSNKGR